jgi:ribosomal protein L17
MGKHCKASPSKMKQILGCTASLDAEEGFPDEESPYAAEGTACHAMAEYLIKKYLKIRSRRPTSDYYTDDNLEAVDEYVSYVQEQIEEARRICKDPVFTVEQKVDLGFLVNDCYGTADMVIITDSRVHIIDLKMGQGVAVSAEQNPQLMTYGLGVLAVAEILYPIETVELTIVQPRLESLSTWEISVEELKAWGNEVFLPKVTEALEHRGSFHPGTDTCRFCKARFQCRARAEFFLEVAQHEFKEPDLLTDEEMADVLTKADALKKWVEEVYTYAQNEAVENRKEWPGFKVVRGKSNRKYADEDKVIEAANEAGFTDIFKTSLIGITEMQRLMGKKKFDEILGGLVYKPEGKLVLVPLSDKREAVNYDTASDDFAE